MIERRWTTRQLLAVGVMVALVTWLVAMTVGERATATRLNAEFEEQRAELEAENLVLIEESGRQHASWKACVRVIEESVEVVIQRHEDEVHLYDLMLAYAEEAFRLGQANDEYEMNFGVRQSITYKKQAVTAYPPPESAKDWVRDKIVDRCSRG